MQKIIIIFIVALLSSCAGMRKSGRVADDNKIAPGAEMTAMDLTERNLSSANFYIQKADVEYDDGNMIFNLIATVKFVVPDEYLISLRLRSGIEIARIYVDSDTVMANDRVNRRLYYGKPSSLSLRYGIPFDVLPVVFGDVIGDNSINETTYRCKENQTQLESQVKGVKLIYDIDCSKRKPIYLRQESYAGIGSEISYNSFRKNGNVIFPEEISILHKESGGRISVNIDKIITPWEGSVEFIPGNNYERVELR